MLCRMDKDIVKVVKVLKRQRVDLIDFSRCFVPWHLLDKCLLNVHLHNIRSYDETWRLVLICSLKRS